MASIPGTKRQHRRQLFFFLCSLRISEEYDPLLVELRVSIAAFILLSTNATHMSTYMHDIACVTQMNQTRLSFAFGSAVQHYQISADTEETLKYQDCFYENFNWATVSNALVWSEMEPVKVRVHISLHIHIHARVLNLHQHIHVHVLYM